MKVYIAGKITGDPGYRDKFAAAEIQLGWQGHTVLNPAELPGGHEPGRLREHLKQYEDKEDTDGKTDK